MPRRRKDEQPTRYAEVGGFWLVRVPGSSFFHIAWNDHAAKQRRTRSTRTGDLREAERLLAAHALKHTAAPRKADPAETPLAGILLRYYDKHGSGAPSAEQIKISLRYWTEFFGEAMVGDVDMDRINAFIDWLRKDGRADGTVSRILSDGRAALNRAWKNGELLGVPFVRDVMTKEDRRAVKPKGRPLTIDELAKLFDSIPEESEHVWRTCVLLLNTMARPDAVFALRSDMVRWEGGYINLNPPGRRQTKKRRGIVPITDTLRPWLELWGEGLYVTYRGQPVDEMKSAFRGLRARMYPTSDAELPAPTSAAARRKRRLTASPAGADINPYSFRHTLGRMLRARSVHRDEISLMLSHILVDENDTTTIYSPHDPLYCVNAKRTIEDICRQIDARMTKRRLVLDEASEEASLRAVG